MDRELAKISKYVNAGADLAESLEVDIRAGKKITSQTVLNLSKFIAAAQEVSKLWEKLLEEETKLQ